MNCPSFFPALVEYIYASARAHEPTQARRKRAHEHEKTSTRTHEHTSTRAHEHDEFTVEKSDKSQMKRDEFRSSLRAPSQRKMRDYLIVVQSV